MTYKGKVHKLGDHIDTDAIIPARLLVTSDPQKLGPKCMSGLDPDWAGRVSAGDFIVAGRNFGCGSSREHAPIAIAGCGIPAVIGHSFARIFYRNAFNQGLPLLEIGDAVDRINDGDELEVNLAEGKIHDLTSGETIAFLPIPDTMRDILDAGGIVGYVRRRLETGAAGGRQARKHG